MHESLKIINSKSQQLLHFIDSYRQVAELPKPKKNRFNLKKGIENVLKIFETEFKNKNIEVSLHLKYFYINADEKNDRKSFGKPHHQCDFGFRKSFRTKENLY